MTAWIVGGAIGLFLAGFFAGAMVEAWMVHRALTQSPNSRRLR